MWKIYNKQLKKLFTQTQTQKKYSNLFLNENIENGAVSILMATAV